MSNVPTYAPQHAAPAFHVPDYLAQVAARHAGKPLIEGGRNINRISLKNNRFHLVAGGQIVYTSNEAYLDVVILASSGAASRLYFDKAYDPNAQEKARPFCWSSDGKAPDANVPAPCAKLCALCPKNAKGSAMANGAKAKACGYFTRLAVVMPSDPELTVYQLDAKGGTLFGPDFPANNYRNLVSYSRFLQEVRCPMFGAVTRVTFDFNSATPKLLFSPVRVLTPDEIGVVEPLLEADDVKEITTALVGDFGGDDEPAQQVPVQPAPQPVPQQVMAQAPVQYAPQPVPQQVMAQAPVQYAQPAPQPVETVQPIAKRTRSKKTVDMQPAPVQEVLPPQPGPQPAMAPVQYAQPAPQHTPTAPAPQAGSLVDAFRRGMNTGQPVAQSPTGGRPTFNDSALASALNMAAQVGATN